MSRYQLVITTQLQSILQELVAKARSAAGLPEFLEPASQEDTPRHPPAVQEFEDAYVEAYSTLTSDNFYLSQELREARLRWVSRNLILDSRCRWSEERNLSQFADFLEHLLDENVRAERPRLVQSAWSIGLSPYGMTNQEIVDSTNRLMESDMDAAEALFEEDLFQ